MTKIAASNEDWQASKRARKANSTRRDTKCLAPRELEIARLLAQGLYSKEVAGELGIAVATVSTQVRNLYLKLEVTNRVEMVRALMRNGYSL